MSRLGTVVLHGFPPFAYFVICFAIGCFADAVVFGAPHLPMPETPLFWLGFALLFPALYFGLCAVGQFLARRLDFMPGRPIAGLVKNGPYAFSRNPMYLGLALLHAGLCLVFGLPVTLAMLVVPLLVMQFAIVPHEEEILTQAFGEEFAQYCRKVRRWL